MNQWAAVKSIGGRAISIIDPWLKTSIVVRHTAASEWHTESECTEACQYNDTHTVQSETSTYNLRMLRTHPAEHYTGRHSTHTVTYQTCTSVVRMHTDTLKHPKHYIIYLYRHDQWCLSFESGRDVKYTACACGHMPFPNNPHTIFTGCSYCHWQLLFADKSLQLHLCCVYWLQD